jgi:hypothetical protein
MAPLEIRHRSVRPISAKHAQASRFLQQSPPYEYIAKIWTSEPDRFILNPIHQMPGLNN